MHVSRLAPSSALYLKHGLCQDVDLNREQLEGVPFVLSRVLASLHDEQGCGHFLPIRGAETSIARGILIFGELSNGEPRNCNRPRHGLLEVDASLLVSGAIALLPRLCLILE